MVNLAPFLVWLAVPILVDAVHTVHSPEMVQVLDFGQALMTGSMLQEMEKAAPEASPEIVQELEFGQALMTGSMLQEMEKAAPEAFLPWLLRFFSSSEHRSCATLQLWIPSEIELYHYRVRSHQEFMVHRGVRYANVEEAENAFQRTNERYICPAPTRIKRFLSKMKALSKISWSDRVKQYHLPEGICVSSYDGHDGVKSCRPHFLTAVVGVNQEDQYLSEWLKFHSVSGFDHFVVYDQHNSSRVQAILEPYIANGIVTYYPFLVNLKGEYQPGLSNNEHDIYHFWKIENEMRIYVARKIQEEKSSFWVSFFDLDEFFFPRQLDSLRDVLMQETTLQKSMPAAIREFYVKYLTFGASGWEAMPRKLQVEAYDLSNSSLDGMGKSIGLVDRIPQDYWGWAHELMSTDMGKQVLNSGTDGQKCDYSWQDIFGHNICLSWFWAYTLFNGLGLVVPLSVSVAILTMVGSIMWIISLFLPKWAFTGAHNKHGIV